jgi:cytochrome bd-type quinol oxidase subunit 2
MIKKLKLMILSLSSLVMLAVPIAIAVPAAALTQTDINNNLCQGSNLDLTQAGTNCSSNLDNPNDKVTNLIKKIINILSVIIGAIAVVMIIVGGFRYITSGGNAEGTKAARQTIVYAIVGLIIVALAQIIVHFVLNSVNNAGTA